MTFYSHFIFFTWSSISSQIDEWYSYLMELELEIREALSDGESFLVHTFVTYDIAGYFLEVEWFLEEEKKLKILAYLR